MDSAIDDFFFWEQEVRSSPELKREYAKAELEEKANVLLELIKDDEKAVQAFETYCSTQSCLKLREFCYYYTCGFRRGFRIAVDCLKEEE